MKIGINDKRKYISMEAILAYAKKSCGGYSRKKSNQLQAY